MTTGSLAALVSKYGLLAVFGGTLLEGEGILIVAATLSAQGVLDPVSAALIRLGLQCLVSSDYCQAPGGVRWQLP